MSTEMQLHEGVNGLDIMAGPPTTVVEKGATIANALMSVAKRSPALVVKIQGRSYMRCELWTTMLAMLSVVPRLVSDAFVGEDDELAYEATVELCHLPSGNIVGRATSMASSAERMPWGRQEFSVRSMAQTRAVGKAARLSFSWIPTLAGFAPTPAEEMPQEEGREAHAEAPPLATRPPARTARLADKARRRAFAVAREKEVNLTRGLIRKALKDDSIQSRADLTVNQWDEVTDYLRGQP